MYWVKLTRPSKETIWVNLYRFDHIFLHEIDGSPLTRLVATLSETEEDHYIIDVLEDPNEFIPATES